MRYLQWSTHDLASGMGGVEVHARSLDRELKKLGIDSRLSASGVDPIKILQENWDVIHTHGASPLPLFFKLPRPVLRLHTLHGTTLGRMHACNEWLWPGGYLAYGREVLGIMQSQIVLAVHSELHLLLLAKSLRKKTFVCGNGWDPVSSDSSLDKLIHPKGSYFCYVGRGEDIVKNTSFLQEVIEKIPDAKLVAIPGLGFRPSKKIISTGRLGPEQILEILKKSHGLLLPSLYEGLPLVVLEALGAGVEVMASPTGGVMQLNGELKGLHVLKLNRELWISELNKKMRDTTLSHEIELRSQHNRKLLKSWGKVAEEILKTIQEFG